MTKLPSSDNQLMPASAVITSPIAPLAISVPPGIFIPAVIASGLETAIERLREAGARRILMLNVGGAFHSPLMQSAQDELAEAIVKCPFNEPICPVYQNVTASPTTNPEIIRKNLIAQLTSPVRWTDTVRNMVHDGATRIVEFGPAPTLQNLVKRITPEIETDCLGSESNDQ